MARAPRNMTTASTAWTVCCQLSQTGLGSGGSEGWAEGVSDSSNCCCVWDSAIVEAAFWGDLLQVVRFQSLAGWRSGNGKLGEGIFARLARLCHGTEGDVRAISGGM